MQLKHKSVFSDCLNILIWTFFSNLTVRQCKNEAWLRFRSLVQYHNRNNSYLICRLKFTKCSLCRKEFHSVFWENKPTKKAEKQKHSHAKLTRPLAFLLFVLLLLELPHFIWPHYTVKPPLSRPIQLTLKIADNFCCP